MKIWFILQTGLLPLVLAPPKTYPEAVNLTADNSLPYILTGGFRPVSSIPELAKKIKYTRYRIILWLQNWKNFIRRDINNNSMAEVFVNEDKVSV